MERTVGAARCAVNAFVQSLLTVLERSEDALEVLALLRCAARVLPDIEGLDLNATLPALVAEAYVAVETLPEGTGVASLFYDGPFDALSDALLTVVADDWLACLPQPEAQRLLAAFYEHAPIHVALAALARHLNHPGPARALLVQLMCADNADGALRLLQAHANAGGSNQHAASWREHVVRLVVSVPDRLGRDPPTDLLHDAFYATLLRCMFSAKRVHRSSATLFVGAIVNSMCRRGYAAVVADVMVPCLLATASASSSAAPDAAREGMSGPEEWGSLAAEVVDVHAAELLAKALIRTLCAACAQDDVAVRILQMLYGGLLRTQSHTWLLFSDKMLVQSMLPRRCRRWIILWLVTGGDEEQGISVVAHLAHLWVSSNFIHCATPKQQSYVTGGLVLGLGLVSSAALNAHDGLLPSLLDGVSRRLEHPTEAMRMDGMHLGNAVARALDPTHSAIFEHVGSAHRYVHSESEDEGEDKGDAPQSTTARTVCSAKALPLRTSDPAVTTTGFEERHQAVVVPAGSPASTSSAEMNRAAALRGAHMTQGALAEGGDDPDAEIEYLRTEQHLGGDSGSDYDGRDCDGEASADSDDSLSPFEMSEDEEESTAAQILGERDIGLPLGDRSSAPRQLCDVIDMLRKPEDSVANELALSEAGSLIQSAGDEMDVHADELLVALVHVRPSAIDEDATERQQRDAVVTLLVRAPLPAGAAAIREFYSPTVDMRQRLLILDAMTAAASELSRVARPTRPFQPSSRQPAAALSTSMVDPRTGGKLERTHVWGHRSLELRAAGTTQATLANRNRFTPQVAMAWVLRLMHQYDAVGRHGANLMGDDCLVLGRLLVALGALVEASGQAGSATPALGAALLELVASRGISQHPKAFVRRCMLLATAHVLGVLSVASVQAALEAKDPGLAQGLVWVQDAMPRMSTDDTDPECCTLAYGCFHLASELVQRATKHRTEEAPDALGQLLNIGWRA